MIDKLKQFITSVRTYYLNAVADPDVNYDVEIPSPKELAEQFELIGNFDDITVLGEEMSPMCARNIDERKLPTKYPTVMIQIDNVKQGGERKTNLGTYYLGLYCTGFYGFSLMFYVKHHDWILAYEQEDKPFEPYITLPEGYGYGFAEHPHIRQGNACMGGFEAPVKGALNSLNFIGGIAQIKNYINSWNVRSQFTKLTYFKPKVRYKVNLPIFRLNNEEKIKYLNRLNELDILNPRSSYIYTEYYKEHEISRTSATHIPEDYTEGWKEQKWSEFDNIIDSIPDKEEKKPGDFLARSIYASMKVPEPKLSLSCPYSRSAGHLAEWQTAIIDIMIRYHVSEEEAMEVMRLRLHKRNTDGNNVLLCKFLEKNLKARSIRGDFRVIKETYDNETTYSHAAALARPMPIENLDTTIILNSISKEPFETTLFGMFKDFERKWINISTENDDKRIWWIYQDAQNYWTDDTKGLYRSQMIERVFQPTDLETLFSKKKVEVDEESIIEEMTTTVDRMHEGLNILLMEQCTQSITLLNKERKKHETKLKNIRESLPANQLAFGPLFEDGVERPSVLQEDRTE